MDKFQQRFIDEAGEYFEKLELALLNLENDFSRTELVEEVFRVMHSLKGSGAMFGFNALSEATHELESLFDSIRSGTMSLNSSIIGFSLKSLDLLKRLLSVEVDTETQNEIIDFKSEMALVLSGSVGRGTQEPEENSDVGSIQQLKSAKQDLSYFISFIPSKGVLENGTNPLYLIDELHTLGECKARAYMPALPGINKMEPEHCYTNWRAVLNTTEELSEIEDVFLFVKEEGELNVLEIKNTDIVKEELHEGLFNLPLPEAISLAIYEKKEIDDADEKELADSKTNDKLNLASIRVSSNKIDEYMNLVSEMITAQSRFKLLAENKDDQELINLAESFQKLIRQLRDNAFNMSLVPLYSMMARFKRLVRDLSAELNKEVVLSTEGLETEVDKNMIEKLTDPILHIIRNCIDHGIETPEERIKAGKDSRGKIHVKASYVGTFVQIEILDDGSGLNYEKIRQKAVEKGLLDSEEEISYSDLIQVLFEPGFSTVDQVSGVSGRGVGMDIIRQAISSLRGETEVDSVEGEWTQIVLRVPLTLSIIDGLLTRVEDDYYVIPTSNIEKIYAFSQTQEVNDFRNVVVYDGREIPYLKLRDEFDSLPNNPKQQYLISVNINENDQFGLVVDDVVREYQAVMKPIGKMLKNHDVFLGASILGDGKVAMVIDINKITQKYSA